MASAKEFRENADDCLVWAKTVTSDHERAIFLDMARNWLEAASRAEGRKITYKLRAKRLEQIEPAIGTTGHKASSIGRNGAPQKGRSSDLAP
jgi:hypothetical protein